MKEMSVSRHRARDLVTAYDHSLEKQIVGRGSHLACRDEELWKQVEGLLRDGDAQETHCLGVDPLRVMEETLTTAAAAAATKAGAGRVKARGLQGLAKAFEVLEQAALNLYLGPWRDEYKVVKMYSGMFTHYIKPVLSMPQIEKLFGLLGYQLSPSGHEQLHLQASRVSPASLEDLLCLSCAFFLARCECCLLLTALGKHVGEAQWELSVVRERQRGNSVQVALDNTKKTLRPVMEPLDGELDVDLYTDEHVNGGQAEPVANDNESPRSLTWATQTDASPPAAKSHSNGVTSPSTRGDVCVSTFNCQLPKTSLLDSDPPRSSLAGVRQSRRPCEESRFDSQSRSLQAEAMKLPRGEAAPELCGCLQSPHVCLKLCLDCDTSHDIACALLQQCYTKNHCMAFPDDTPEEMKELRAVSPPRSSLAGVRQSRRPCVESRFDSQSRSLQAEAMRLPQGEAAAGLCSCLQSPHVCLKLCLDCDTSHDITCALLQQCYAKNHCTAFPDDTPGEMKELKAVSPQTGSLRASDQSASPTLSGSSAAISSLALHDEPKSMIPSLHPIAYHDCCNLAKLDPWVLCLDCNVFHSGSCRGIDFCQSHHSIKPLGRCSCGRQCSRKPLVLCRYCGNEYCSDCWYRNPVFCSCGQTFDQSSSV